MAIVGELVEGTERTIARVLGGSALSRGQHVIEASRDWEGLLIGAQLTSRQNGSTASRPLSHEEVVAIVQTGDLGFAEGVMFDAEQQRIYLPSSTLRCIGEMERGGEDEWNERRFVFGCIADGSVFDTAVVVDRDGDLLIERGIDERELIAMTQLGSITLAEGVSLSQDASSILARADAGKSLLALRVA